MHQAGLRNTDTPTLAITESEAQGNRSQPAIASTCPVLCLIRRTDPLTGTPDPLTEEIQKVRYRRKRSSNACQYGRRMVDAEVLVHRDRDYQHATSNDVSHECDSDQRRCGVPRESLDDVHVDREEDGEQAVPEEGASTRLLDCGKLI